MKLGKGFGSLGILISMTLIFASNASVVLGVDWSEVTPSPTGEDLEGVTFGDNLIVAVGDNGMIVTSSDGVVWESPDSGTHKELRGVARGDEMFVAVGNDGTIVRRQDDEGWILLQDSGTGQKLRGVTWSGSQFIAVGNEGTIVTSSDGMAWSVPTAVPLTGEDLNGVTVGKGLVVVVGDDGTIFTSPDAVVWTSPEDFDTRRDLESVAWSGNQFVAVGNEGTILTSPDAVVWTSQGSITEQRLKAVTWGGTQFVAVGDTGAIFTSPDGEVWTPQDSGTDLDLEGVTWDGTQFVTVGEVGTILTHLVRAPDIAVIDTVDPVNDLQIHFGNVAIDFTSEKTITITNTGNDNLKIGTIALGDEFEGPFTIVDDGCSNTTLAPAETCTLTVKFAPTVAGNLNDSVVIPSNDADENTVTVVVSGEVVNHPVPDITVTDSAGLAHDLEISFGDIAIGNPQDQTVTITNDGSAELIIGVVTLADPFGPFSISVDGCSGETLQPGETCELTIRFDPTNTDDFNGTLRIPSDDEDEDLVTVSISGTGLPGGVDVNNPPSAPQLLSPANEQTGLGTDISFRWLESTDPDGDDIIYTLSICKNVDFTGPDCGPTPVTFPGKPALFLAALGGSGAGLFLFGFVLIGGVEGRKNTGLLIAIIIATGMLFAACSSGGGGIVGAGAQTDVTVEIVDLDPDTKFHWKVTADDGNGGITASEPWSFTTKP